MAKEKGIILIVDDIDINRMLLRNIIQDEYQVIEASSGQEALKLIFEDGIIPTAVLLDIIMPGMDGFEVLEQLKCRIETEKIPVLFITAADSSENESRGLKAGAADYVSKPFNFDVVRTRLDNHINLTRYQNELENLVEEKTSEVTRTYEQTLEVLATIIEYRSLESGVHIRRTCLLTEIMVNKLLTKSKYKPILRAMNYKSMIKASALHDIGKIGISDAILLKPGKLTDEEFGMMKAHTTIGSEIIDSIATTLPDNDQFLKFSKEICHYHHERWDGNGYPCRLKGEEIPLSARILSIIDVYDALVNPRCYKAEFPHDVSLKIILDGRGTQFDPELVDVFMEISEECREIEESLKG